MIHAPSCLAESSIFHKILNFQDLSLQILKFAKSLIQNICLPNLKILPNLEFSGFALSNVEFSWPDPEFPRFFPPTLEFSDFRIFEICFAESSVLPILNFQDLSCRIMDFQLPDSEISRFVRPNLQFFRFFQPNFEFCKISSFLRFVLPNQKFCPTQKCQDFPPPPNLEIFKF